MKQTPFHDTRYKALFSCPEVMRDLLQEYVPGEWLKEVKFETLERKNASFVSTNDKQRHSDMVWRVDIGGKWLWVYVLLEFQSRPDSWMAVRVMQYVSMLAEQLLKERVQNKLPKGRLPPILPIVLYNGKARWRGPCDVADCFHVPPGGLEKCRPSLSYVLIDEHRLQHHPLPEVKNFAEAVFRLETSRQLSDFLAVVGSLREMLRSPELQGVRLAFNQLIKGLLQDRGTATMIEDVAAVEDVFEGIEMLDKYKGTWFENEARENFLKGREEGRKEGREEGREEGLISVARNMLKCGKPVNEIVEATGLQPETIQSLMH